MSVVPLPRSYFPRYCKQCGKELEKYQKTWPGYDVDTGKRVVTTEYRCPSRICRFFSGTDTSNHGFE